MKTIEIEGIELAVEDRGEGPPVMLLHGFPLNHSMWSAQVERLVAGHRVIAPDLRGFGGSTVTPGAVTMDRYADDVGAMLEALEVTEPVVFCGFSMGGYVAFSFWRRYRSRVRAYVLADTRAMGDTPDSARDRLKTAQQAMADGPETVAKALLPKLFSKGTLKGKPEVVEAARQMILSSDPAGIAAALRGMAARADSRPLLNQITVPTLLIVGVDDAITPPDEMLGMAELMRQAEVVEVPNAGHLTPMENPEAFNDALVKFLDRI
ncbi:MAG TPA: alpha/beta fold hydrolase [Phycisphaerae bacterium]|nr:alpha/beta fold hydrolase [Phycisphaerae bacterium]